MGFLPRANVLDDVHAGLLRIVNVDGMRLHRELALIFRKDRTLSHAAQVFLETATGGMAQSGAYPPPHTPKAARASR
jgi:DNA-binding transcriptional LysR family regulator